MSNVKRKKALWKGNRTLTRVLIRCAPYTTPSDLFPVVVAERPATKNLKSHRGGITEGILSSFPHPLYDIVTMPATIVK